MLVLTRKVGETLQIGDDIEIKITEISGDKVRIGIAAPAKYKILRGELIETIAENLQAAAKGYKSDALKKLLSGFEG